MMDIMSRLSRLCSENTALPISVSSEYIREIADYIFDSGYISGNKNANIKWTKLSGDPKVLDFTGMLSGGFLLGRSFEAPDFTDIYIARPLEEA
jgi:hypothetical protein